ncbi:multidrug transporter [Photobacterium swingsii]|uniref:Multidrug transporter MdtL n=1 Tax=Photobacterium swingsii TaxID=680026 RepID=A0A0J8XZV4_9GAMM|nr:MFS transporter [Photobacterium swingsii]KMV30924.1 multidrug transporter [Photobacterium swingsii]PSW23394.1 multidrug transporter MdtL [Photobacterium swingsii]
MVRYLLCSFALVLLYPTAIDLYLVGLPHIAQDLGASESQLHIAFSIYLAGMATTMLFAGKLSDSMGRKPIAIFGAITFALASQLGGLAESSSTFLIARFAQGIGAGSCYVVAFAILRDTLDDQRRAKVLSMINGITCIVPVLAPVLGHLIMLKFPWPTLFTTMASMGVLVCLIAVFVLRETNQHKTSRINAGKQDQTVKTATKQEPFLERFFVSRLIITSIGVTTILTYVNTSPMLVMGSMGYSRGDYSSVMALTALVSMITSFSAPFALSVFKQRTLMLVSQTLLLIAGLVLLITSIAELSASFNLLGFALICGGFSLGFGVAMSQALSPFALRAGMASSLLGIAQVCSSALFIWFMGIIGVNALNMLAIVLAFGGIICVALILLVPSPSLNYSTNEEIVSTA